MQRKERLEDTPEYMGSLCIGAILVRIREARGKKDALRFAHGVARGVNAILALEMNKERQSPAKDPAKINP